MIRKKRSSKRLNDKKRKAKRKKIKVKTEIVKDVHYEIRWRYHFIKPNGHSMVSDHQDCYVRLNGKFSIGIAEVKRFFKKFKKEKMDYLKKTNCPGDRYTGFYLVLVKSVVKVKKVAP